MAGMLPGVESARRRRIHGAGDSDNRRSSFYLFTPKINHDIHHTSNSTPRNVPNQPHHGHQDEKLDRTAREAKGRLDERLRRRNSKPNPPKRETLKCMMHMDGRLMGLQTEVLGQRNGKRSSSKIFGRKMSDSDQEECAICLDTFKTGETLVNLSCAHRFHSNCLIPWVESNAHCPFCRMEIISRS